MQYRGQRIAVRIGVVSQHTRTADRERRVLIDGIAVVHRDRRMVYRYGAVLPGGIQVIRIGIDHLTGRRLIGERERGGNHAVHDVEGKHGDLAVAGRECLPGRQRDAEGDLSLRGLVGVHQQRAVAGVAAECHLRAAQHCRIEDYRAAQRILIPLRRQVHRHLYGVRCRTRQLRQTHDAGGIHSQRDRGGAGNSRTVHQVIGETVRPDVAGGRRIDEGAVRVEHHRPMRRQRGQLSGKLGRVFRVQIVGHHAGRRHGERGIGRYQIAIVHRLGAGVAEVHGAGRLIIDLEIAAARRVAAVAAGEY